jgi:lipopolysaccharide export system permease protein
VTRFPVTRPFVTRLFVTRLEKSIAREFLLTFTVGAGLYLFLFLFFSLAGRGQFLGALPVVNILEWLAYQVPANLVQSFPLAMVFAVMLAFGRLARDHELLAAMTGGISLARAVRPIIVFGAGLVVIGLLLAEFVVPRANQQVSVTWWDSVGGGGLALTRLQGRTIQIGEMLLRFEGFDAATQELRDVRLEFWQGRTITVYEAKTAQLEGANLKLRDALGTSLDWSRFPLPERLTPQDVSSLITLSNRVPGMLTFELGQSREQLIARNAGGGFEDARSLTQLWQEWQAASGPNRIEPAVSFGAATARPFASLIILLLVIPLASSVTRSVGVAFGLAALVTLGYFLAIAVGQVLGLQQIVPSVLGPWLANLAFAGAGLWLIRRDQTR